MCRLHGTHSARGLLRLLLPQVLVQGPHHAALLAPGDCEVREVVLYARVMAWSCASTCAQSPTTWMLG